MEVINIPLVGSMNVVNIYTDGSFNKDTKAAGAGVWFGHNDNRNLSKIVPYAENIIHAEFCAVIYALEQIICSKSTFIIHTDSQPVFRMLTTHKDRKSSQKYKFYMDAVEKLKIGRKIEFNWIQGHSGIRGNKEADRLAKKAMKNFV